MRVWRLQGRMRHTRKKSKTLPSRLIKRVIYFLQILDLFSTCCERRQQLPQRNKIETFKIRNDNDWDCAWRSVRSTYQIRMTLGMRAHCFARWIRSTRDGHILLHAWYISIVFGSLLTHHTMYCVLKIQRNSRGERERACAAADIRFGNRQIMQLYKIFTMIVFQL